VPEVLCPICGNVLQQGEKTWRCDLGHGYDVARQGYVNLLPVQQKHSLQPGDTREQVAARKAFLDAGYYAPIAETLKQILSREKPSCILDVGCGEGYYLTAAAPDNCDCWGVDISKDAIRYAAVRNKAAHWLVGTASHLPFSEESFSTVISMFALTAPQEFHRVLLPGGLFIQVTAHPAHLLGLKSLVYPRVLQKAEDAAPEYPEFFLEESRDVTFSFALDHRDMVAALLTMTPHFWRIGKDGAARAAQTDVLNDTARVIFRCYRKE